MKKIILFTILFLSLFGTLKSQVYRFIPDSNFRYVLSHDYFCPFDISGDSLDISAPVVAATRTIICYARNVDSIDGIQYFPSLRTLDVSGNHLTNLSALPDSLSFLWCTGNNLRSLPPLPDSLQGLQCSINYLATLPTLPSNLRWIDCQGNDLTSLPVLPPTFESLNCSYNDSLSLPLIPLTVRSLICDAIRDTFLPAILPDSLRRLGCAYLRLLSLPDLPPVLTEIWCDHNRLTSLPTLPDRLTYLNYCNNNIPAPAILPGGLQYFLCQKTNASSLPPLPSTLLGLACDSNIALHCLPYLPSNLSYVHYLGTSITCIPNIVPLAGYSPTLGSHPLCNPLIDACPSHSNIMGITYFDTDSDCVFDSVEAPLNHIKLTLRHDTTTTRYCSSAVNGLFGFETVPDNTYTIEVDTNELPLIITCPISGFDTVTLDPGHTFLGDRNFSLQCKPGFDVATTGLITDSRLRPASSIFFNLYGGDAAKLHGVGCSSIPGNIIINYTGHLHYTAAHGGSLMPDSILPNRLIWNIADFSTLDFFNAIKPEFYIDSSAIIGDLLCFTTEVTPSVGDRVPSNNTFSQCFTVRTSYDPNIKEVSPYGSVTSSQGWLYYTIHFQNTGSSYAQNIYVLDTIDSDLDLYTIQVMSSSHDQVMQVYPNPRAVKFNFININLIDSTTDEPNSHGFVQYRIKLKSGLSEGTSIQNTASILFDLNSAVVTNTTTSTICNTSIITQTFTINDGQTITVGSHHYSQTGVYTDILTNIHGCDSIVTTTIQIISGFENISPSRILCYPNPANNSVLVQLEGLVQEPLVVYNIYGRKIFSGELISNKYLINTESFSEGTYVIQCGNKHQKLVVKH